MTRVSQEPNLSVVICTLSRPESVKRVLTSICSQSRQPEQIIVVDASEDRLTERVVSTIDSSLKSRVEYYRTEKGLTKQRNYGLRKAMGDIIGFLDDDVVLDNNYIEKIIEVFENDKENRIGGATGYIYHSIREVSGFRRWFDQIRWAISGPKCLSRHYNMPLMPGSPFDYNMPIRYVSGCNMFFRREVFKKHRFNEWFAGYGLGEDREFGLRVSKEWIILAVGQARLHHYVEPAGRPDYRKVGRMLIENPCRIIFVSRDDMLFWNGLCLVIREFVGASITTITLMLKGHIKDALGMFLGASEGLLFSVVWIVKKCLCVRRS